jgi:hypothetical protein
MPRGPGGAPLFDAFSPPCIEFDFGLNEVSNALISTYVSNFINVLASNQKKAARLKIHQNFT